MVVLYVFCFNFGHLLPYQSLSWYIISTDTGAKVLEAHPEGSAPNEVPNVETFVKLQLIATLHIETREQFGHVVVYTDLSFYKL